VILVRATLRRYYNPVQSSDVNDSGGDSAGVALILVGLIVIIGIPIALGRWTSRRTS
jgi:hypothetical protein